jgi:hypothetical protein
MAKRIAATPIPKLRLFDSSSVLPVSSGTKSEATAANVEESDAGEDDGRFNDTTSPNAAAEEAGRFNDTTSPKWGVLESVLSGVVLIVIVSSSTSFVSFSSGNRLFLLLDK